MPIGTITLTKKGEERVQRGHPWIFRSDAPKAEGLEPGTYSLVFAPPSPFFLRVVLEEVAVGQEQIGHQGPGCSLGIAARWGSSATGSARIPS